MSPHFQLHQLKFNFLYIQFEVWKFNKHSLCCILCDGAAETSITISLDLPARVPFILGWNVWYLLLCCRPSYQQVASFILVKIVSTQWKVMTIGHHESYCLANFYTNKQEFQNGDTSSTNVTIQMIKGRKILHSSFKLVKTYY